MAALDRPEIDVIIHKLTNYNKRETTSQTATSSNKKPIAIFMCGPTASGKSTIKQYIAKGNKLDSFVNLDQDEVSKHFPEESRDYVRKTTLHALLPRIFELGQNVIIDRTCRDVTDTIASMKQADESGYYIILAFSYIDKEKGLERLIKRNKKERKVSIEVYEDIYKDFENRIIKRFFIQRKIPYNEIVLFDNSGKQVKQILYKKGDKMRISTGKEEFLFYGTSLKDISIGLNKKGGRSIKRKYKKKTTQHKRSKHKRNKTKRYNKK